MPESVGIWASEDLHWALTAPLARAEACLLGRHLDKGVSLSVKLMFRKDDKEEEKACG